MTDRTITVTGIGTVAVKPDLVVITMSVEKTDYSYSGVMQLSSDAINTLKDALVSIGYERDSLKTTDFNINTDYERYKDSKGNWKSKFSGYKCSHSLKLEFDLNMEMLNRTLSAIASSGANPEYRIIFSVKDKAAVSDQLLTSAIKNATDKAIVLAKAANLSLGSIQKIDYSWGELRLFSETRMTEPLCYAAEEKCLSVDIEPEDIKANDTVTVIWSIAE